MLVWLYTAMTTVQPVPAPGVTATQPVPVAQGRAVLTKYQCNRCHQGTGLPAITEAQDCVGCHRKIHAGAFEAKPELLAMWKKNIVDLTATPSLVGVHQRLKREWLRAFLKEPHDLRPKMTATMPRLAMTDADADLLARYLVPHPPPQMTGKPSGDPALGRKLLETRGCGMCHQMSGAPKIPLSQPKLMKMTDADLKDAMQLAPDLAHTRDRFQTARLVTWLKDPKSLKRDALMPAEGLSDAEAEHLAAYLLTAPLNTPAPAPMPKRLPVLKKRISYEDVAGVVFGHTCIHCHADPDYAAIGDGGPGNTGGFGFAPRGINLTEYAMIQSGHKDPTAGGERRSLFTKKTYGELGEMSLLVASLWARHAEVRGKPVPGVRGMPLGLPPLAPEQIQLIETWVAQGRPE